MLEPCWLHFASPSRGCANRAVIILFKIQSLLYFFWQILGTVGTRQKIFTLLTTNFRTRAGALTTQPLRSMMPHPPCASETSSSHFPAQSRTCCTLTPPARHTHLIFPRTGAGDGSQTDLAAPAMLSRGGGYERLGRVRSTLHRSQSVVICLIPAAKHR